VADTEFRPPQRRQDPSDQTNHRPDGAKLYTEVCFWFARAGLTNNDASRFIQQIAAPIDKRFERPHRASVIGGRDAQRWVEPYRDRLIHSAQVFAKLSQADRELVAACCEEGTRWRGEPVQQFVRITEETVKMRQVGVQQYSKHADSFLREQRRRERP